MRPIVGGCWLEPCRCVVNLFVLLLFCGEQRDFYNEAGWQLGERKRVFRRARLHPRWMFARARGCDAYARLGVSLVYESAISLKSTANTRTYPSSERTVRGQEEGADDDDTAATKATPRLQGCRGSKGQLPQWVSRDADRSMRCRYGLWACMHREDSRETNASPSRSKLKEGAESSDRHVFGAARLTTESPTLDSQIATKVYVHLTITFILPYNLTNTVF